MIAKLSSKYEGFPFTNYSSRCSISPSFGALQTCASYYFLYCKPPASLRNWWVGLPKNCLLQVILWFWPSSAFFYRMFFGNRQFILCWSLRLYYQFPQEKWQRTAYLLFLLNHKKRAIRNHPVPDFKI